MNQNTTKKPHINFLITGGAGFIGSNFIKYLLKKYQNYRVINIDKLTYCGNLKNLEDFIKNPLYKFINGDICNKSFVEKIAIEEQIDVVVNFAAESAVDRSIQYGEKHIQTNINGVRVLLEVFNEKKVKKFIQISTDEVYGETESDNPADENFILNPSSTYSVSKAAADLLCKAYHRTYDMPIMIVRPVNNFGPYQFPEKIISRFVTNILQDKPVSLYGDGQHLRNWIFVEDTCNAIDTVLSKGTTGEIYNISTNNSITNLNLTKKIINILGQSETLIKYVEDRPGHDKQYYIDSGKIRELGWYPIRDFEESLKYTVHWYKNNVNWWKPLLSKVKLNSC